MDIFGTLIEYIEKIVPIRIIHTYEQGVRWSLGRPGPILKAGIYFFVPGLESIDTLPATLSPAQFEIDFQTLDGKECTTRIGMEYKIADIVQLYSTVQEGEIVENLPTLSIIASGLATGVLSNHTLEGLWANKEIIEEEMTDECNAEFNKKGIEIIDMRISSLKTTAGYKVFLSQSPKQEIIE